MNHSINHIVNNNILQMNEAGIDVIFDWPIADVLCIDDVLVIRIEPDPGTCFNENVYGVSKSGNIIWRVEKRRHIYDDSPYTSIIAKDHFVKIFNWDLDELLVDPTNGKVIDVGYRK